MLDKLKLIAQSNLPTPAPTPSMPQAAAQVVSSPTIWQYLLLVVYFIVCATLVTLVLVQTSKSEGLTGTLGGTTQSVFRGKRSFEERLNRFTTYIAIMFVALSILIAFFAF